MSKRGVAVPVIVALAVMVALFFGSFMLGQYPIPPAGVVDIIGSRLLGFECSQSDMAQTIVWKVRLPRIMAALLIGAALSVAGAVYQGLFKNPPWSLPTSSALHPARASAPPSPSCCRFPTCSSS